jgi:hypothetical protein
MAGKQNEQDHLEYLQRFWAANSSVFMKWFLSLPYAGQVSLLRNASPDLPAEYRPDEPNPKATQLLTPELSLKALLCDNGKSFLRLMNARSNRPEDCLRHDMVYLGSLRSQGTMPTFSGEAFRHVSLAYIDPVDPEQNVMSLLPSASEKILEEKKELIAKGRLIEADVWLTLQMRQQVIMALLTNVAHTFETMFLQQVIQGEVTKAEIGCRYCGSSTREEELNTNSKPASLLLCACEMAFYCCKEHQVKDWPSHKAGCKTIRKARMRHEEVEKQLNTSQQDNESTVESKKALLTDQ